MSNMLSEFVSRLSEDEMRQIHKEYHEFVQNGSIGDSALRSRASEIMKELGANDSGITIWMTQLASEIWRQNASPLLSDDSDRVVISRSHFDMLVELVGGAIESESDFMTDWDIQAKQVLNELGKPHVPTR